MALSKNIKTDEPKKVPKKRGRKPKPKTAESLVPKVPKKRGRKPKVRTLSTVPPVMGITEQNENIIMHIPLREDILISAGMSSEENRFIYKPVVEDPRPYDPNEAPQRSVCLNTGTQVKSNFFTIRSQSEKKAVTTVNQVSRVAEKKNPDNASVKVIKLEKSKDNEMKVTDGLKDFININSLSEWPKTTSISCWWCCHQFDTMPIGLPQKKIKSKFLVTGCFCSFNCALAYNSDLADFKVSERASLLKLLFRKLYPDMDDHFHPSPRKEVLKKFGGSIDVEDYRKNLHISQKEVRILMPPVISLAPQIEEIRLKKKPLSFGQKKRKEKFIPLDMKDVERAINNIKKREKPKARNSLQITMGLTQG
jgi:hypothetical protein